MKPCPNCNNLPIMNYGIWGCPYGYILFHCVLCCYSTIPRKTLEEAILEWEDVTSQVSQWMKDKKLINYGSNMPFK